MEQVACNIMTKCCHCELLNRERTASLAAKYTNNHMHYHDFEDRGWGDPRPC